MSIDALLNCSSKTLALSAPLALSASALRGIFTLSEKSIRALEQRFELSLSSAPTDLQEAPLLETILTMGFHLGAKLQSESVQDGYDQGWEDRKEFVDCDD